MIESINSFKPTTKEKLNRFFSNGGSLKDLVNTNVEDHKKLYTYANQLFSEGEFEAASNIYYLLSILDHCNFEYVLALGVSYQRLEKHEAAISMFSRAGLIKINDPRSAFFAGLSYRLLGHIKQANKAFNAAILWCDVLNEYKEIRSNAIKMRII